MLPPRKIEAAWLKFHGIREDRPTRGGVLGYLDMHTIRQQGRFPARTLFLLVRADD
jgi:hypothetical protein